MNLLRCVLPSLLTLAAVAAADAPPIVSLTIGDGARLITRFEASVYAKLWNDRSMEGMRLKTAEWLGGI
jgi:hypothetical protein